MITEVIEYIRQQCVTAGITTAFQDLIPSNESLNVCAVRSLPGSSTTNTISCDKNYSEQLFSVLYRGTDNRLTNLNTMDDVFETLNNKAAINLTNTYITSIIGTKPAFAFEDENGIAHYNLNVNVIYNKK